MLRLEKQIKKGIELGVIKFVIDPNMESGTVCQIGDNWFYFGGQTAEDEDPEEYLKNTSEEDNIRRIAEVLLEFQSEFPEEYAYYMLFLNDLPVSEDNEICLEFKCPLISKCSQYHGVHYDVWGEGIGTPKGCPRWDGSALPF